ncbi:MAG: hypothetical protein RBT36_00780 [Desulfobulbus sp.]|jgi:hypothetical protein|nr:hypothetical protein [Desulfobulbus sp.]
MTTETFPIDRPGRTLRQRPGAAFFPLRAVGLLRALLFPLAVVVTVLLALPALSKADNTISGSVSLPSGTAPAGGLQIGVYAVNQDGSTGEVSYTSGTIPNGQTKVPYTLSVPSLVNAQWLIYYVYGGNEAYVRNGYYSSTTGTLWQPKPAATPLPGGQDYKNINLTLLTGKTISGSVSLPSGTITADDVYIVVTAADIQNGPEYENVSTSVVIKAGQASASYRLRVVPNANASWQVSYFYLGDEAYARAGYYSTAGTQGKPVQATRLPGGNDHGNINLTLLASDDEFWPMMMPAIINKANK